MITDEQLNSFFAILRPRKERFKYYFTRKDWKGRDVPLTSNGRTIIFLDKDKAERYADFIGGNLEIHAI